MKWMRRMVFAFASVTVLANGLCAPVGDGSNCDKPLFQDDHFIWDCNVNFDLNDVFQDALDHFDR